MVWLYDNMDNHVETGHGLSLHHIYFIKTIFFVIISFPAVRR